MTCRHSPGDTSCSSHPYRVAEAQRLVAEEETRTRAQSTPDAKNYVVEDVYRHGPHLVLKVRYPNCAKCSYEGVKILVYLNVSEAEVLRWKTIDPHFRDPQKAKPASEAPGPVARFPASAEGWADAITYVAGKLQRV